MKNRLKEIFESVAYAGMKPSGATTRKSNLRWLGPLRGPVERFLNGPASTDPFYLTNRTMGQRVRMAVLLSVPFLVVGGLVYLAATGYWDNESILPPPAKELSKAEIASKMLPDLNKDMNLETNKELQVSDVVVSGGKITGSLKNKTDHTITAAEVIFDLANGGGSRVGAVSVKVARIDANSSTAFSNLIPQADASYAIVREVHNQ